MRNLMSAATLAALLIASPANATMTAACKIAMTIDAVEFRGSAQCNHAWMDRPAALSHVDAARHACKGATANETMAVAKKAMAIFDEADAKNHAAACKQIDDATARDAGANVFGQYGLPFNLRGGQ